MYDFDRVAWRSRLPAAALLIFAGAATAQAPTLEHGPPFLGGVLELIVESAPPGARVTFVYSPSSGSMTTPFGVLELDRPTAVRLGVVFAAANGRASFDVNLPLDPGLAESEAHYQALVADPGAPAGAILTESVALRWLGPRVYVGTRGRSVGPSGAELGALEIFDALHGSSVGRIDYPGPVPAGEGDGEPVFSTNQARGAVMASASELLIFDPFFATTLGVLSFQNASRSLLLSPDGTRAYVLEPSLGGGSARISTVDLALGQVVSTLDLPAPTSRLWDLDEASHTALIGELSGTGQTLVRVVDLGAGSVGNAYAFGGEGSRHFDELLVSNQQLFLATRTPELSLSFDGRLSRAALPLTNASLHLDSFPDRSVGELTPMNAPGYLLAFFMHPFAPPSGALQKARLSSPSPWASFGLPWVYLHVDGVAVDGSRAWVIDAADNEPPGGAEVGRLYELETATDTWTTYAHAWFSGPTSIAAVADGLAHKVFITAPGEDPPISISPELLIIDLSATSEQSLRVGWAPEALVVVPLP